jgi:hypothetical protein
MTVTAERLRIELLESALGAFFESGSPNLNADGHELLVMLAQELANLANKISVEGHTDSKPFAKSGHYGNRELSSDRANSARRLMQSDGLRSNQVAPVRGFADQRLRKLSNRSTPPTGASRSSCNTSPRAKMRVEPTSFAVTGIESRRKYREEATGRHSKNKLGAVYNPPFSLFLLVGFRNVHYQNVDYKK